MSTRKPLPRGLFKRCACTDPTRCSHDWYGNFKLTGHPRAKVSLSKWTGDQVRTLGAATAALDDLKAAVRAGTFDKRGRAVTAATGTGGLTFAQLCDQYFTQYAAEKWRRLLRLDTPEQRRRRYDSQIKPLVQAFGAVPIARITTPQIEDWQIALGRPRRMPGGETRTPSQATINRAIADLRRILNWAVRRDLLAQSPFRKGGLAAVRLGHEDNARDRRISSDEEDRLIACSAPQLRALIILAIDAGLRMSEMLELRVADVDLLRHELTLRGATTKSAKTRRVPIATARIEACLVWLSKLRVEDPQHKGVIQEYQKRPTAALISNEAGEALGGFRTAWETAILHAHGHQPAHQKPGPKPKGGAVVVDATASTGLGLRDARGNLTPHYRVAFKAINLHWHDLRHEYASRLAERGVPLTEIQRLLGHASPLTTARYISSVLDRLKQSTAVLEAGKVFDASTGSAADQASVGASIASTVQGTYTAQYIPASKEIH